LRGQHRAAIKKPGSRSVLVVRTNERTIHVEVPAHAVPHQRNAMPETVGNLPVGGAAITVGPPTKRIDDLVLRASETKVTRSGRARLVDRSTPQP
jgi:hypothetical protein